MDSSHVTIVLPLCYLDDEEFRCPRLLKTSRKLHNTAFCLDDGGAIHTVCTSTLLPLAVWNEVRSVCESVSKSMIN